MLLLLLSGVEVVVEEVGGVELDGVEVRWPFGVGEMSDGVVVDDEEPPPATDSPSSDSSLSYSTASFPCTFN